jgi:N-acetylmuramoyl-L-alanine amidase
MRTLVSLFALVYTLLALSLASAWAAQEETAIAFAARVVGDDKRARLIVDFDKSVKYDAYLLADPRRIIIDLSQTAFSLTGEAKKLPTGLVRDLRYGTIGPGQSRIVLELARDVVIENHSLRNVAAENRHRLLLDLVTASAEKFASAVRKSAPKPTQSENSANPQKTQDKKTFTVVLDPGHGGIDGGAEGAGKTAEKTVTLNFAKHLKASLQNIDQLKVLMTREDDRFVSLSDRVDFAKKNHADLFISIHADSLRQRNIRGATIYTLSEEGTDDQSRALAQKQNRADLVAGLSLPKTQPKVTDILIDLTRRETQAFSVGIARLIVRQMKDRVRLLQNPHRSADFYVLKAPEFPSVLLELGYLSNVEDEKLMKSEEWQTKAANIIGDSIEMFFQPRLGNN